MILADRRDMGVVVSLSSCSPETQASPTPQSHRIMERAILPLPRRRRAQPVDVQPATAPQTPPLLFSLPSTYEAEGHHHHHGHHHGDEEEGETSDDQAFESHMVMVDDEDLLENKKKRKIPSSPSRTVSCSAMGHRVNDRRRRYCRFHEQSSVRLLSALRFRRMKRRPVSLSTGQRPPSGPFSFKCPSRASLYLQSQATHELPSAPSERSAQRHKLPNQARRGLRRGTKKPEEEFWMCEYCEYEAIFGEWPMALMRGYDAKERRERRQVRERQRLLQKAKHKNRQRPPARRPPPPPSIPPPSPSPPQQGGIPSSAIPKLPLQARTISDPTPMNGYRTTTSKSGSKEDSHRHSTVAGKGLV